MPHFFLQANADGSIQQIYKDGEAFSGAISLETPDSIVKIYFQLAAQHLQQMSDQQDSQLRRSLGLQSFLMSLTGLEAFTNTYFHVRAMELNNEEMLTRIAKPHGSLSKKIADLIELANDGPLIDQEALIGRIFSLSQLRNEIVHPRWQPSSMTYDDGNVPLIIQGLVQNFQVTFENHDFCREAFLQCLLVLARCSQALGRTNIEGFMFRWAGQYGMSLEQLLIDLGLEN